MKKILFFSSILALLFLASCVTTKKFKQVNSAYEKLTNDEKNCQDQLKDAQAKNEELTNQKNTLQTHANDLQKQVDHLMQSNTQVLNTLQDLSVLSNKQAESVKSSLENLNQKDAYIMQLQSAMARRDSLNLLLVGNLTSALHGENTDDINIKVDKGVVYVDISDKLLFNSGSYLVTSPARKVLGKVAQVLNAYPDVDFMVEGHTDNKPIHTTGMEDNWDLSSERAASVIRILQNQYKINPARMTAAGRSEYIPIATNDTKEGRALNRRTRIAILPQLDQFFKLLQPK